MMQPWSGAADFAVDILGILAKDLVGSEKVRRTVAELLRVFSIVRQIARET